MKRLELEEIIEEEIYNYLDEKSVPQPYDRKKARRMSKAQISNRDKIGKKMKSNPKVVARFRKKYGDEWEDYLWASASSRALGGGFKKKGGSSGTKSSKPSGKSEPSTASKKTAPKKKARNKSDVKLNPDQKKNADAMYKQLQRLAKKDGKLDETALMNYINKLEQKFSMLTESHQNFDGPLMTKILHAMVRKIKNTQVSTTGDTV